MTTAKAVPVPVLSKLNFSALGRRDGWVSNGPAGEGSFRPVTGTAIVYMYLHSQGDDCRLFFWAAK